MDINKFKTMQTAPIYVTTNSREYLNLSDIIDRLIRVAAKDTEYYAGDLFISIETLKQDIKDFDPTEPFSRLLGFRKSGVDHDEFIANTDERDYRSIWRIDVEADKSCMAYEYIKVALSRLL